MSSCLPMSGASSGDSPSLLAAAPLRCWKLFASMDESAWKRVESERRSDALMPTTMWRLRKKQSQNYAVQSERIGYIDWRGSTITYGRHSVGLSSEKRQRRPCG